MSKDINAEQIMSNIKYTYDVEDLFDDYYGIFTFGIYLVEELQSNAVDAQKLNDDLVIGDWDFDELEILNYMRNYVTSSLDKDKYNSNISNTSIWYRDKKIDDIIKLTYKEGLELAKTLAKSAVSAKVKIDVLWFTINALVLADF